jgi:glutathione-specific gamma-glutamylcyclotransferase
MWVFGYGSLMCDGWEERERPVVGLRVDSAALAGYRRSFNKKSVENWGIREAPAPTLGLEPDQNANCIGTAFEFPDAQRTAIENRLRDREGKSFALVERAVRLPDGERSALSRP